MPAYLHSDIVFTLTETKAAINLPYVGVIGVLCPPVGRGSPVSQQRVILGGDHS